MNLKSCGGYGTPGLTIATHARDRSYSELEQLYGDYNLLVRRLNLDWDSFFERDSEIQRLARSIEGVDSLCTEILWGVLIRILKNTSLIRAVHEVFVLTPRGFGGRGYGDVVFTGKLQQSLAASETGEELWEPPGG